MALKKVSLHRVRFRSGSPELIIIALLLYGIAAALFMHGWSLPPQIHADGAAHIHPDTIGESIIGGLFFLGGVGSAFTSACHWTELDRASRRVRVCWGILFPWTSRAYPLTGVTGVQFDYEIRENGRNSHYKLYRLWLLGEKPFEVGEYLSREEAAGDAKEVAEFLGLPPPVEGGRAC